MRTFEEVLKEHQAIQEIKYDEMSMATARVWYGLGIGEALKAEIEKMEKELGK